MANTYTQLLYHVVFSTKTRLPTIEAELQDRLFPYLGGIIRTERGVAIAVGGMPDHVHILMRLPTDISVADILRLIKSNSSRWMNDEMGANGFAWQTGYSAFTVSASMTEKIQEYIHNQKTHHCRMTFQEEIVALLKRHGIEFDERYVWD